MQTSSQIQLLPAVTDNATFYLVMQPKTAGLTNSMLVSPTLTFNPSSNSFQLNGVSIGSSSTSTTATVTLGTTTSYQVGSFGVGTAASGVLGEIRAANNITAYYSSDSRLKENVVNIPNALSKVKSLNGVSFDWTDKYLTEHGGEDGYFLRKHDIGIIAQELEEILPEIVADRPDGYKAVKYERIVALLIEAVKELSEEVERLKESK
jgi:hypothetical protein